MGKRMQSLGHQLYGDYAPTAADAGVKHALAEYEARVHWLEAENAHMYHSISALWLALYSPGQGNELFARNQCERLSTLRESANKKLAGSPFALAGARRDKGWGGVLDSSKPDFPKACDVAWYSAWYGA